MNGLGARACGAILAAVLVASPAVGEGFRPFAAAPVAAFFPGTGAFDAAPEAGPASVPPGSGSEGAPPPPRPMFDRKTVLVSTAMLAAVPIGGYALWWHGNDFTHFKFNHEHWFGRDTYSGGADKASHFVVSTMIGHSMQGFYRSMGHTPSDARWLSIGVVGLAGLLIEAGDGFKFGGASWEDALMNVGGGVVGAEIAYEGWDDLVGFRYGLVPAKNRGGETGPRVEHYSQEIYTADAKLGGMFRRGGAAAGPLRYLMVSATYATRGYRELPPALRERNLGVEIGLNVPEILRASGFREEGWWRKLIYAFFDYVRVPYTAVGWRYDFNHRRWHGPDTGQ